MLGRNLTSLTWMIFCFFFDSCDFFFCWYRNLPKSMMRQTGGLAVGATSTRSSCSSWAFRSASSIGTMPPWPPSASTRRTSRTRMRSLIRVVLSMSSSPPGSVGLAPVGSCSDSFSYKCLELAAAGRRKVAHPREKISRVQGAQVLAGAPAHRDRPLLRLARPHHQHVGDLLELRLTDAV